MHFIIKNIKNDHSCHFEVEKNFPCDEEDKGNKFYKKLNKNEVLCTSVLDCKVFNEKKIEEKVCFYLILKDNFLSARISEILQSKVESFTSELR